MRRKIIYIRDSFYIWEERRENLFCVDIISVLYWISNIVLSPLPVILRTKPVQTDFQYDWAVTSMLKFLYNVFHYNVHTQIESQSL